MWKLLAFALVVLFFVAGKAEDGSCYDVDPGSCTPARILVIGSTGAGKSTLIRALTGDDKIAVSDGAKGCTSTYSIHKTTRHGRNYEFIDTVGLNEPEGGTVSKKDALKMFFQFLKDNKEGFNLVIFCNNQGRLSDQSKVTYEVMVKSLYSTVDEAPPVLLIFGGTFDQYAHPQEWCEKNRHEFVQQGIDEAKKELDRMFCLSFPQKAVNPIVEAAYSNMRKESTTRAWKAVDDHIIPQPLPFYKSFEDMVRLLVYLWNKFVDVSRFFGISGAWLFKIPDEIEDLWEILGLSWEDFRDPSSYYY